MTDVFEGLNTIGCGSYSRGDVHFLLRVMEIKATSVQEKERLIQTRQRHYSEMISQEQAPCDVHQQLYRHALAQNAARMAADIQGLANALHDRYTGTSIALVSFVRAGVPVGVLLRRALIERGRDARHYGVSIIRDRGIDNVALDAIIKAHGAQNIVFVDGWTGKGAISGQLRDSLANDSRFPSGPRLVVLADPCGCAWLAASAEDWLIPSGVLGATVSGLVSRSIWPSTPGLHGCVRYDHLAEHDVTMTFIHSLETERARLAPQVSTQPWTLSQAQGLQRHAQAALERVSTRFSVLNSQRIKPGIAEATRAVMRRVPEHVLVRRRDDQDVQLLMHLTRQANIEVQEVGDELGPYRAVTVIRSVR
ncbi:cysteine protease StiP family protein [Pseudomonas sp. 7P_10.2_Bac1]|uniref:cysteine protease StiP family protein n=1 Tax=Pseudomonas sp. 7P_10.2_Bac1 TaxID=2971614 RepID=UPI0021C91E2F|nr:cysteine protease StiP family protein [Pseudomonas sp. 7P_10.2_Bac1]MCU1726356.1 cysteine protease StiP family protein [Pseudomonas sp. 7P_10.2_Bac1]